MTSIQAPTQAIITLVIDNPNTRPAKLTSKFARRREFDRKFKLISKDAIDPRAIELADYLETKFRETPGHVMHTYLPDDIPTELGKGAMIVLWKRGLRGVYDATTSLVQLY